MKLFWIVQKLQRHLSMLLILSLLVPSLAYARSKSLTPQIVHDQIVKRGVGGFVSIQESNGIALHGHVTNIGSDTFAMQPYNQPQIVTVNYADVVWLNKAMSRAAELAIIGVTAGLALTGILIGIYEAHKSPPVTGGPAVL